MAQDDMGVVVNTNPNTSFVTRKRFWFFYTALVASFYALVYTLGASAGVSFTATNILHSLVSFILLHWWKGSPIESTEYHSQGKYDKLTFWEQIEGGSQFTPTKKFLTIVPVVLLLVSAYADYNHLFINLVSSLIVILGKLPAFHGVRILGINKD